MIRAEKINDKSYRLYSDKLWIGGVAQTNCDGTWHSYVNSVGTLRSRAPYATPAAAAKARWGVAGRDAIIDCMLAAEKAES